MEVIILKISRLFVSLVIIFIFADYANGNVTDDLFKAVQNPKITSQQIDELIKNGADVNIKSNKGWTVLMRAAFNNSDPNVIKILAAVGADVNAKNDDGWTALMEAVAFNPNPDVVKALIEAGANLN